MTRSPLENPTPFLDRLDRVRTAFSPVAASPSVAGDMIDADDGIGRRLDDLKAKYAGPSADELAAAGEAYARGKGTSKVTTVLAAPTTDSPRFAAVFRAAAAALTSAADAPAFSPSALIEECAGQARDYMAAIAREATAVLDTLPAATIDRLNTGRGRLDTLDTAMDANKMSVEDIQAHREAAGIWSNIYATTGLSGHAARTAHETMARAVATGSLTGGHELKFGDDRGAGWAVWFDAPGCAALAAGFHPSQIILEHRGTLSPLLDIFGADADTYRHRVTAYEELELWAGHLPNVLAPRLRQYEPLMSVQASVRRSVRGYSVLERAGLSSPDAALSAYMDAHPTFAADIDATDSAEDAA
jgi:hypothetical protein